MPLTISPIKKEIVKQSLLKGNSARTALKEANYSKGSIRKSTHNAVVKVSIDEILSEFKLSEITPEYVISSVNKVLLDNDATNTDRLKASELLGKFLAIWKDRTDINVQTNVNPIMTDAEINQKLTQLAQKRLIVK